jgi:hypothetical protein
MPRNRTRFCVQVNGKPRELVSAIEANNGRVTLRIRSGAKAFELDPASGLNTKNHKISIHPPGKSPTFNLIHMTQDVEGRSKPIESHLLTDAVKAKKGFCQIYVRRCMNLNADWFVPDDIGRAGTDIVVIDQHNVMTQNLIHSVLVGAPDAEFAHTDKRVVVTERVFSNFKIVLLHSMFFFMPAAPTGNFIYISSVDTKKYTFPDDDMKQEFDRLVEGQSPTACIDEFWLGANSLMEKFVLDRLEDTKAPVPLGISRDHLTTCLGRFSQEANRLSSKVRPALVAYYRDPRFLTDLTATK